MKFIYFVLFCTLFFSCSTNTKNTSNLIAFTPKNANIIIKIPNLESFKNSLDNNDFLSKYITSKSFKTLKSQLKVVAPTKPETNILICFSKDKNDSFQYTLIAKHNTILFKTDSLKNYTEEALSYKNRTITKRELSEKLIYSAVIDSFILASSSKLIIDEAFKRREINLDLEKIYNTTSNDKTASVIIKSENAFLKSFFINDSLNLKSFTNYLALDTEINQDEILINGITQAIDSSRSLINIFKNTVPQQNAIQTITPSNSEGFMSFTFNDFEIFKKNLYAFNKKETTAIDSSIFNAIIEVGVIYTGKNKAIVLNSTDVISTKDALLGEQNRLTTFRKIDIYSFSKSNLFRDTFTPLITYGNANKYCVLDNFFVFSENIGVLQNIISNYINNTTLSKQRSFKNINTQLSDESSLLQVVNASLLNRMLIKNNLKLSNYKADNYSTSAIQFVYDNNFAHVNAVIKKNKTSASLNSISEELSIKLEHDLLTAPQFVTNHVSKQKDIVVQDVNNNLYLISNKGKIFWKKQLEDKVLGKIEQIDIYKNGRLQLAFATSKNVYVIDRKGNDVGPFPIKFKNNLTQPLSVFDYEKNKKYRLLVTQGENILMYDTKATLVRGFNFKAANGSILNQPKHFRIGSKDYISFKTNNKLYLLNRTGDIRVSPKKSSTFSNEDIFLYNNKFTTTNTRGDLITIDNKGNTTLQNYNLSKNHYLETTSKTIVLLTENKLTINNKTIELNFGQYQAPKIFYLNDKIYVALTDIQSQKIYLYDSQTKLIPNFPVYGNSVIDLNNIDKDKNLEFITKGENNSIILYQIN